MWACMSRYCGARGKVSGPRCTEREVAPLVERLMVTLRRTRQAAWRLKGCAIDRDSTPVPWPETSIWPLDPRPTRHFAPAPPRFSACTPTTNAVLPIRGARHGKGDPGGPRVALRGKNHATVTCRRRTHRPCVLEPLQAGREGACVELGAFAHFHSILDSREPVNFRNGFTKPIFNQHSAELFPQPQASVSLSRPGSLAGREGGSWIHSGHSPSPTSPSSA